MENFIARQPIFNCDKEVAAYELLFRNGFENAFDFSDGTEATSFVMVNSLMLFGMRALTDGNKAFINVTEEILAKDYVQLFPQDLIVAEILEDVTETQEAVSACLRLKKAGYQIALDDVITLKDRDRFSELVDIIKVDFMHCDKTVQQEIADRFSNTDMTLLAEKIETPEEFKYAVDMGYTLFQGYFFAKPEILSKKNVPGDKIRYMQLMRQIHKSELDFDQLETLIKHDMSLSYRLLRYINSAFFGWRVEIRSIKQALVLLGENEIKKWATLVTMAFMGSDKPSELIMLALTRARFCEFLAPQVKLQDQAGDLFLMGMFSVLDAVMNRPLEEILEDMPISESIVSALLGEESPYRPVLDMAMCYERGEWDRFSEIASQAGANESEIPDVYLSAIDWANQSLDRTSKAPSANP
ncbi:MAG: HDOD domain-containing protein [Proteobacteria bacterium]|nr:HDOD domain-containing protein [Pseudomonadota bacterium]